MQNIVYGYRKTLTSLYAQIVLARSKSSSDSYMITGRLRSK